jgi:catechol 2,3-dioxygenase-like lactoylglutathione lyase family enzyme
MINIPSRLGRRDALKAVAAVAVTSTVAAPKIAQAQSQAQSIPAPDKVMDAKGEVFTPIPDSNPLEAKISAFTTVSPDVDASIEFYRDVIGMDLLSDERLSQGISTAPGIGRAGRRHVLLAMPKSEAMPEQEFRKAIPESGFRRAVRVLEAPPGAEAIRPRPGSGPQDPGLLVMEGGTRDPAESYHALASAGTPMISPPRYYYFRNTMWGTDVDVMSYAPFGPGGEQMFITASIRSDQQLVRSVGIHNGFGSASVTALDQRPVNAFFEKALGLKRTSQMECYQDNVNELIGSPAGSYFLWGNVGTGVGIEVWEMKAASGTVYPCSLDKTGLAMLTLRVNDLGKCRAMCAEAGIEPVGEGALPNLQNERPDGFTLRGAVGELYEVVGA